MSGKDGKGGRDGKVKRIRRTWRTVAARVLFCLPVLPAFPVLPALSQTDARLVDAIRQAQDGRGDSARTKVRRLLAATSPTDTLYPQIIYTQAMVASDANEMRRQLQRVAVEYSSSSWADDALLRLVQLDYASANLSGAARNLERIRLDYPGSTLLPQAAYWAARTYFDQKNPELACRWIADGLAGSSNIELQNQLGYLDQRCAGVRAVASRPPTDSQPGLASGGTDTAALPPERTESTPSPASAAPAPPRAEPAPVASRPAGSTGRFRVQITAVRTPAAAAAVVARLKAQGLVPVTVEEGGLFKVRVGNYATRPEAVAVLPDLKAKLGGSPFVVAEP
jgi:cell division septation protein DedD